MSVRPTSRQQICLKQLQLVIKHICSCWSTLVGMSCFTCLKPAVLSSTLVSDHGASQTTRHAWHDVTVTLSGFIRIREMSGKFKIFQGQGIVREFYVVSVKSGYLLKCQGNVREFYNFQFVSNDEK